MPTTIVSDLKALGNAAGRPFAGLFVLRKVTARTASNGNTYLSVELGDRTGSFTSTVFNDSPAFGPVKAAGDGAVLRVEGKIEFYQDRLSPRLARASVADPAELAAPGVLEQLVETSPENPDALWEEFLGHVGDIGHPELRETARIVFEEIGPAFRTAPAAVFVHHAYRHGLLEHTTRMARAAKALLPLYPEVDADLARAGIVLHDIGKTVEYEGTLAPRRGRHGILQGHVVLGYQMVRKAGLKAKLDPDRLERLEHIILSHQGKLEWGAAALAATPEAVFVSMVDNLDARMGVVQRALRQGSGAEEFSERLLALESPLLLQPVRARPDSREPTAGSG
jgi:3'-5' exoribonuclease